MFCNFGQGVLGFINLFCLKLFGLSASVNSLVDMMHYKNQNIYFIISIFGCLTVPRIKMGSCKGEYHNQNTDTLFP